MADLNSEFLGTAIALAEQSVRRGGFPAGSVVVKNGIIIGEGMSLGSLLQDPTSHSDIAAIRAACIRAGTATLSDAVLYSSVQPCLMCLGASAWGGISKIFFACAQSKLAPAYYAGHYSGHAINQSLLSPIPMTHIAALEEKSFQIVQMWERSLS